jgi:hypothetical protein
MGVAYGRRLRTEMGAPPVNNRARTGGRWYGGGRNTLFSRSDNSLVRDGLVALQLIAPASYPRFGYLKSEKGTNQVQNGLNSSDLRADIKREHRDAAGAERRRRKALEKENSSNFEHYGRIAALYFLPTGRGS